jgi:hypothetical protein
MHTNPGELALLKLLTRDFEPRMPKQVKPVSNEIVSTARDAEIVNAG